MKNEIKSLAKSIGTKIGKKNKITDEVILDFLSNYIESELANKISDITIEFDPNILITQAITDNKLNVFKKLTNKKISMYRVLEVVSHHRNDMFDYLKSQHDISTMYKEIFETALMAKNNVVLKEMFLIESKYLNTIKNVFEEASGSEKINRGLINKVNEIISNEWLMEYLIFEQNIIVPTNLADKFGKFIDSNIMELLLDKKTKRDRFVSLDENLIENKNIGKKPKI